MQRLQDENVNTIYIGQAVVYWASTKNVKSSFRKGDRPLYWNFRSA
jgi:hypothetical protein